MNELKAYLAKTHPSYRQQDDSKAEEIFKPHYLRTFCHNAINDTQQAARL